MGKYYNLKEDCSIQDKAKLKEITKGQREKILPEDQKQRKAVFKKLCRRFKYPGCRCHKNYEIKL